MTQHHTDRKTLEKLEMILRLALLVLQIIQVYVVIHS